MSNDQLQGLLLEIRSVMDRKGISVQQFGMEVHDLMGSKIQPLAARLAAYRWFSGKATPKLEAYFAMKTWLDGQ